MKELTIEIKGEDTNDLTTALEAVTRLVEQGFIEGWDKNDSGSFHYEIEEQS